MDLSSFSPGVVFEPQGSGRRLLRDNCAREPGGRASAAVCDRISGCGVACPLGADATTAAVAVRSCQHGFTGHAAPHQWVRLVGADATAAAVAVRSRLCGSGGNSGGHQALCGPLTRVCVCLVGPDAAAAAVAVRSRLCGSVGNSGGHQALRAPLARAWAFTRRACVNRDW